MRGLSGSCLKPSLRQDPILLRAPGSLEEGFQWGSVRPIPRDSSAGFQEGEGTQRWPGTVAPPHFSRAAGTRGSPWVGCGSQGHQVVEGRISSLSGTTTPFLKEQSHWGLGEDTP